MNDFRASDASTKQDEDQYLRFLIDEGLVLLAKYRQIPEAHKRQLVVDLIEALADGGGKQSHQSPANR